MSSCTAHFGWASIRALRSRWSTTLRIPSGSLRVSRIAFQRCPMPRDLICGADLGVLESVRSQTAQRRDAEDAETGEDVFSAVSWLLFSSNACRVVPGLIRNLAGDE